MPMTWLRLIVLATICMAPSRHAAAAYFLFEHPNFEGATIDIPANHPIHQIPESLDNRASSIRVAPGCVLIAFHEADFKGPAQTWGPGDYPKLPPDWDDVIS